MSKRKTQKAKKLTNAFLATTVLISGVAVNTTGVTSVSAEETSQVGEQVQYVAFKDKNLESAIKTHLNITDENVGITKEQMLTIKTLNIDNKNITYLNGLEEATNLTFISMRGNKITNLDVFDSMTNLEVIYAPNNYITNINGIANLDKLTSVNLSYNLIKSVPNLRVSKVLQVNNNLITSVSNIKDISDLYFHASNYGNSGGNFVYINTTSNSSISSVSTEKSTVESNATTRIKNVINIGKYNYEGSSAYNVGRDYSDLRGVETPYDNFVKKIKWLDEISITALHGSIKNIQFRDGSVFYDYVAPKNLSGKIIADVVTVQLFEGYSVQQTINIEAQTKSVVPMLQYNDDVQLEGIVTPNSVINVYNAVGELVVSQVSEADGYINIDMKKYNPYNKLYMVKQIEEGLGESSAKQVEYKDTTPPKLRVTVPNTFSTNSIELKVDVSDDVGVSKVEYFSGEVDVDTTANGTIIRNNVFHVKKNGTYTVKATDINGNSTIQKVVINHISNEYPNDAKITLSSEEVTDEPVKMTLTSESKDDQIMYRINDGDWIAYYTPITLTENGLVEVKVINKFGNESNITSTRVSNVITNNIAKPSIVFDDLGESLSISSVPNGSYEVLDVYENKVLGKGTLSGSGKDTFYLDQALENGDRLKVTVQSPEGKSASTTLTFVDTTPPKAVEGLKVSSDGKKLSGKAEANSTIIVSVDGKILTEKVVDNKGNFEVVLPSDLDGKTLSVTVKDSSGNKSDTNTIEVVNYGSPSQDIVGGKISGKSHPDNYVTLVDNEGNILTAPKQVNPDGTYDINIPTDLNNNEQIQVIVRDTNGTIVSSDKIVYKKIVDTTINKSGTKIFGYKTDVTNNIDVVDTNGNKVAFKVISDKDGYYELELTEKVTKDTSIVTVESDKDGKKVKETVVKQLAVEPTISENGQTIVGNGEKGTTIYAKDKDGKTVGTVYVGQTGQYVLDLSRPMYDGEKLTISEVDKDGNTTYTETINYTDNRTYISITPDLTNNGNTIKGETKPYALIEILNSKGEIVGTSNADKNGQYVVKLTEKLAKEDTVNVQIKDKSDNEIISIFTVMNETINGEDNSTGGNTNNNNNSNNNTVVVDNTEILSAIKELVEATKLISDSIKNLQLNVTTNPSEPTPNTDDASKVILEEILEIIKSWGMEISVNKEVKPYTIEEVSEVKELIDSGEVITEDSINRLEKSMDIIEDEKDKEEIANYIHSWKVDNYTILSKNVLGTSRTVDELTLKDVETLQTSLAYVEDEELISEINSTLNDWSEKQKQASLPSDKELGYSTDELKSLIKELIDGKELTPEVITYLEKAIENIDNQDDLTDLQYIIINWYNDSESIIVNKKTNNTEKEDNSNTDKEDNSNTEKEDNSNTEKEDNSNTEKEDNSNTEKEDNSNTDKEDNSNTEKEDNSNTEKEDNSNTDKEDNSNTEKEDNSNTDKEDNSNVDTEDNSNTDKEDNSNTEKEDDSNVDTEDNSNTDKEDNSDVGKEDNSNTDNGGNIGNNIDFTFNQNIELPTDKNTDLDKNNADTVIDENITDLVVDVNPNPKTDIDTKKVEEGSESENIPQTNTETNTNMVGGLMTLLLSLLTFGLYKRRKVGETK